MMMTGEGVLVTGGAGFIGSHTCKHLALAGYRPVVLDNLSVGHVSSVKWGPLVRADVRDSAAVTNALRDYEINTVMHFAASAYVGESVDRPLAYYDNNVSGMIAVLQASKAAGVKHFVFSSSCATYGAPVRQPISEGALQAPTNPYGHTKLMCEQILKDQAAASGMTYAILRYFNAAGSDEDGELAEKHSPETHIIPLALMAVSGAVSRFQIYGADYDTPDGTCVRDYIHVTDLARGHIAALQELVRGAPSFAVNLGSGTGHSVREILAEIEAITGCKVPVTQAARRAGDPPVLVADPTRARDMLGFEASRSGLQTILRDAAPHFGVSLI